jgi:hypothetical protein
MKLLAALTELFVNIFQITRPRPEHQRRAYLLVGGLTLAVLLLVAGLTVGMLVWAFHA